MRFLHARGKTRMGRLASVHIAEVLAGAGSADLVPFWKLPKSNEATISANMTSRTHIRTRLPRCLWR